MNMRSLAFIILVGWLLWPVHSNAQFKLGFFGGVNVTNENTPTLATQKSDYSYGYTITYTKSGSDVNYYAGASTELTISPSLTLQLSLLYSVKGYSRTTVILDTVQQNYVVSGYRIASSTQSDFRYHMLDLRPIIYYGLPLGSGKASIGIGPGISYRCGGKIITTVDSTGKARETSSESITGRKFSPAIHTALNYQFVFGLFVHVMYSYVFDLQPGVSASVLEFGLGYQIRFHK